MKKKKTNFRIMGILGTMGSGKTLFMSALAEKLKENYHIFSNYKLGCRDDDITPDNVVKLMKETKSYKNKKLVLLDEFHIFSDSRLSSSHHNILMSYFITQTRKQDIQLIYTTQQFSQVDKRVRENTDILALPKYYKEYDLLEVNFLKREMFTGDYKFSHMKRFTNLKQIFGLYDTTQLIGGNKINRMIEKMENNS